MSDPVKADPAMFSDCGDMPCPQPVVVEGPDKDPAALADGLRMRDNPAEWAFVRLSRLIQDYEAKLDKDEEVAARIVGLPGEGTMQIDDIGFWGPDMILFFGKTDQGRPVRLVQHYAQMNVLLTARPKPSEQPARRIGFRLEELVGKTEAGKKAKD